MSKEVFLDAFVQIQDSADSNQDISTQVSEVTIDYNAELADATAFQDTFRNRESGLKDWSVSLTGFQDFSSGGINDILFGIVGSKKTITIRKGSGAVATDNPEYSGTVILESFQPVGGSVGDIHTTPVTFQGTGSLTRSTS